MLSRVHTASCAQYVQGWQQPQQLRYPSNITHSTKYLLMTKTITRNQIILVVECYLFLQEHLVLWPKIRHPRLPTGWTVRGSNPGGGEIFRTCPDRPWGPPSLLYNGYRVFPGGKVRPGRDADPSPLLVPRSIIE